MPDFVAADPGVLDTDLALQADAPGAEAFDTSRLFDEASFAVADPCCDEGDSDCIAAEGPCSVFNEPPEALFAEPPLP